MLADDNILTETYEILDLLPQSVITSANSNQITANMTAPIFQSCQSCETYSTGAIHGTETVAVNLSTNISKRHYSNIEFLQKVSEEILCQTSK